MLFQPLATPPSNLAAGRLRIYDSQRLSFALKTPWSEGTSHLLLSPMELLEKLGGSGPPARFHLLRYHGVLAPRARDRGRIVPAKTEEDSLAGLVNGRILSLLPESGTMGSNGGGARVARLLYPLVRA